MQTSETAGAFCFVLAVCKGKRSAIWLLRFHFLDTLGVSSCGEGSPKEFYYSPKAKEAAFLRLFGGI